MAETSKIEWTDSTFNPWIGCQKISAGCDHCYAEAMNRFRKWNGGEWGPRAPRGRTSEQNWHKPIQWNREAERSGVRRKVFTASLADWLDKKADQRWREDLADLIRTTPMLDWLLLTKRIENYERYAPWRPKEIPRNVWLGVTCEDQAAFDRRWPIASELPATVHFVSYEPAIGPLTVAEVRVPPEWIICGGETGAGARRMKKRWARNLLRECEELSISFFMKQMTNKATIPPDLMVRQFPTVIYLN